jgi:hypothetical protein
VEGPRDDLRQRLNDPIAGLALVSVVTSAEEDRLEGILGEIEEELARDVDAPGLDDQDPYIILAAVDAWAALASDAVASVYAPASPRRDRREAGWRRRVAERVRRIGHGMERPLMKAARSVGASSWSVSVGYPWGISVGLGWTVPPP